MLDKTNYYVHKAEMGMLDVFDKEEIEKDAKEMFEYASDIRTKGACSFEAGNCKYLARATMRSAELGVEFITGTELRRMYDSFQVLLNRVERERKEMGLKWG